VKAWTKAGVIAMAFLVTLFMLGIMLKTILELVGIYGLIGLATIASIVIVTIFCYEGSDE
jgi:hypothetical protein